MGSSQIGSHGGSPGPCATGPLAPPQAGLRHDPLRLQHILDSIKDYAIITLDGDGCVASWNRGAERLLGYTEEEALGRTGDIFFTSDDRASGIPEREMRLAREHGRATNERDCHAPI